MPKVRKIDPPDDEPRDSKADEEWDDEEDEGWDDEDEERDDEDEDFDEDEGYTGGRWGYFPPSRPIRTDHGIKARNQRGAFGENWWAKRWIAALERFGWGNRLTRGRAYARQGQVLSIELGAGTVRARVQGSRATPYRVSIELSPLDDAQWERVIDALSEQAIFSAQLLAGEMPQEIEQVFDAARAPLFPRSERDLTTSCSCPDFANPCKHIAAVYYLLGERFDDDPFLLFELRGRSQERVIDALRLRRSAGAGEPAVSAEGPIERAPALADQLDRYFEAGPELDQLEVRIAAPEIEAALLRRLGVPPAAIEEQLRAIYRRMSEGALERVFGAGDE